PTDIVVQQNEFAQIGMEECPVRPDDGVPAARRLRGGISEEGRRLQLAAAWPKPDAGLFLFGSPRHPARRPVPCGSRSARETRRCQVETAPPEQHRAALAHERRTILL